MSSELIEESREEVREERKEYVRERREREIEIERGKREDRTNGSHSLTSSCVCVLSAFSVHSCVHLSV